VKTPLLSAFVLVALLLGCGGSSGAISTSTTSTSGTVGASSGSTTTSSSSGGTGTTGDSGTAGTAGTTSSGGSTGGTGTTGAPDSGFWPAAHQPLPTLDDQGGPLWTEPQLVTISYAGFAYDVSSLADTLTSSDWYTAVTAEYGIGAATHQADYVIPDAGPAAATDADTQALIQNLIAAGAVPMPSGHTLYAVFYPESTTVSDAVGHVGCVSMSGYHSDFLVDGGAIPYTVTAACSDDGYGDGPAGNFSMNASHEFFESITDPLGETGFPAYKNTSFLDPWFSWGNELADLCMGMDPVTYNGFALQRVWSNQAAMNNVGSPCIPIPADEVYFNVDVSSPSVWLVAADQSTPQSRTYTLTGWSTAEHPDWYLAFYGATFATFIPSITLPSPQALKINNGSTIQMKVTVPAHTPAGISGVSIFSTATPRALRGYPNAISILVTQ
jgi:hypothetical protein